MNAHEEYLTIQTREAIMKLNARFAVLVIAVVLSAPSVAQVSKGLGKSQNARPLRIHTIPDWRNWMSDVENQEDCKNCCVHAATALVEGQLHISIDPQLTEYPGMNIDLDETDVSTNCSGNSSSHPVSDALDIIRDSRTRSEVGSFPNYQGVKWSITNYHAESAAGVNKIQGWLDNGPVSACFKVYPDFDGFIRNHPTEVYRWDSSWTYSPSIHCVVIVKYEDFNQCWVCRDSKGTGWGDNGYIRIGYGQCGIDSIENCYVTVDQSSRAKIVPSLISSLSTACSGFASGEWAYVNGSASLSGNISIPSGSTLKVLSGGNISFNGYYIDVSNGTLDFKEAYAASLMTGTKCDGLYSSIASALSASASGQTVIVPGSCTVNSELDVPSGVTLQIASGCTLSFSGNYKIHVEGKLLADGVTFTRSGGQWYGIEFYNGSNESSIQYSTIENAQYGLYLYNTFVGVSHCTIKNCSTGAYVYGNSSPFTWTLIEDNTSRGIDCASYGDPNIGPSNVLRSNSWGVYGDAFSVPYLGSTAGYNSLYYQDYYDVYSAYSGTIYALGNWWGSYPAMPSVTVNVDYSSALSSDPNTWAGKFADSPRRPLPPLPLAKLSPSSSDSVGMEELDQAYRLYLAGNDQQALTVFQSVAQRYPDAFAGGRALVFADRLLEKSGQDAKQNLMTTIAQYSGTKMGAVAKSLLTTHLVKEGSYKEALANAEGLLDQPQSQIAKQALYDAGNIGWYHIGDKAKATGYFRTLIAQYPEDPLSVSALATLGEWVGGASPKMQQTTSAQTSGSAGLAMESYPNPFNPATMINYSIPADGMASLKVFDILGREVAVLVNEFKTAGSYHVRFDASSLSSGVYLHRLESGGKSVTQKALLLR
jgi:TolA-binding protein